jgi:hypothetical protein
LVDASRIELILSTIAVLFQPISVQTSVSEQKVSAILRRPFGIGATAEGAVAITSTRDQIEVHLASNKVDVRDLSGELDQAQSKVPRILNEFLAFLSSPPVTSYGINFLLDIPMQQPDQWLANHLIAPALSGELETQLSSRLVVLAFSHPPKVWTVRFESRDDSRINVNLNASEAVSVLPGLEPLAQDMVTQLGALRKLLTRLGL